MEDYNFSSESSNEKSSKECSKILSSEYYAPTSSNASSLTSTYQNSSADAVATSNNGNGGSGKNGNILNVQEDILIDKLSVNSGSPSDGSQKSSENDEQSGGNGTISSGKSSQTVKEEGISITNLGNGVSDVSDVDQQDHHLCPAAAVSSVQLPAYNAPSEPSLNVINSTNAVSSVASSLWSNSIADENIPPYSLPPTNSSVNNGTIAFSNFNTVPDSSNHSASTLYDHPNLINQQPAALNLPSHIQRRSFTSGNFNNLAGNNISPSPAHQQQQQQQNVYLHGKGYPMGATANWPTNTRNIWPNSINNQSNLNNLSNWRGRSVPNLNPMQNLNVRKAANNSAFLQQQPQSSMVIPTKFRRSTSFPGKPVFNQGTTCYDISNMDDSAELILQQYHQQDHTGPPNGNNFGSVGPLDSMNSLHQCLNDMIRPPIDITDGNPVNNTIGNGVTGSAGGDMVGKNSGYLNVNLMRSLNQISERSPFFPNFDDQVANSIIEDSASHIVDGHVYLPSLNSNHSSPLALTDKEEKYSRKVFVGGLPPDIDEEEISASFRRFGPLVVDWPHKAESKSYFPPKGYAFLLFQDEMSVQQLIDACIQEEDKLYLVVSSPTVKDKAVQIRPWRLTDADYVLNGSMPLDPRKTVFVGGVPRPLKAFELATIMDRFYGCVCYAGIDTDPELKYPKGAGRVAFSNQQSYIAAISARFVQLQHGEIDKRVEVKPYVLDDQMCDECAGQYCGGKFAPFFCANVTCLQYYCEHCWNRIHSRSGREFHKPLVKEGADRPRSLQQQYRWC